MIPSATAPARAVPRGPKTLSHSGTPMGRAPVMQQPQHRQPTRLQRQVALLVEIIRKRIEPVAKRPKPAGNRLQPKARNVLHAITRQYLCKR